MKEYDYEHAELIYYTPGELDREAGIWPVRAGRSLAKPHYKVGPKRIECYSLHFIQDGLLQLEFGEQQVQLQKGSLFCLFPDLTYYYSIIPSPETLRLSWLALDGSRAKALLELAGLTLDKPYRMKIPSRATETADLAIRKLAEIKRWHPATAMELQAMISSMFARLISHTSSMQTFDTANWIEESIAYMELHATEGITVQQVASHAGVHRSYFTSRFTSQVGISPMKYLQKIRMSKAKRLLQETNASVTEIALSLGYPSLYSFTRAFKAYYRVPPMAMRK